jgi:lysophospholipid acyltransferase (LPLAT)-like uncharacterized protein
VTRVIASVHDVTMSHPEPEPSRQDASWRTSRSKRVQAALIPLVATPLIRALGATLRFRAEGLDHFDEIVASGRQPVMAFFHGRILPATYYFRGRGIVVMISENFDGEWIARIIERFGYGTARGSSSRGAVKAMLQLKRDMAAGRPAGFAVDGPRGPREHVQAGAVWLAKATGNPLLPFHLEAASAWTLGSWDRTQIPKPFARVALAVGAPIAVGAGADDADIERTRDALERKLLELKQRALEMLR